jgi:hypothetical protein
VKQNSTAYEDDKDNQGSHDPDQKKKIFALFVFLPLLLIVTHGESPIVIMRTALPARTRMPFGVVLITSLLGQVLRNGILGMWPSQQTPEPLSTCEATSNQPLLLLRVESFS